MAKKLYIPTKVTVGFQNRSDTFTGKLGYVIYTDEKGVLRKEKSWQGWRDKKIEPIEFDNKPRSGFVIDKSIHRESYYWGGGRNVIRIHDPENFEFEVTCNNLIGILLHTDVLKRELQGEFVYAWDGTELVLLPTSSVDYQSSVEYTAKQEMKISAKSLIKGATYQKRKTDQEYVYIGYHNWYEFVADRNKGEYYIVNSHKHVCKGKKHIFWNGRSFETLTPTTLAVVVNDEPVETYADLVDAFFHTINSQKIVAVVESDVDFGDIATYIKQNKHHNSSLTSYKNL